MEEKSENKKYLWDIAISLCEKDVDYASKLVKALNPSLKVFFYADRQEELISKSGPVVFAKTFKEESRIVVILSRVEWGTTFYTDIEQNAILDRIKNEGNMFLMIVPMVPGEKPIWYSDTLIYANAQKCTIEELAHFIEFKVTEYGGIIKSITVEERHQNLLDKIKEKERIIQLQNSKEAIEYAQIEANLLKECFNQKIKFLQNKTFDRIAVGNFSSHIDKAHFGIGKYLLKCEFLLPDKLRHRIVTTQDFLLQFELYQIFGNNQSEKLIEREQRLFYYNPPLNGWSLRHLFEQATQQELPVLFRNGDNSQYYDLTKPLITSTLVDDWFQKLLSKSTPLIERYI